MHIYIDGWMGALLMLHEQNTKFSIYSAKVYV